MGDVPLLESMMLYGLLPGAFGGVTIFVYGLRQGAYQNNKYKIKLSIEIIGAALTAAAFVVLFPGDYKIVAAFLIGLSWTSIIQAARKRITSIFEAALGDTLGNKGRKK